jgi:glutaryl-CoA dehydrogenase
MITEITRLAPGVQAGRLKDARKLEPAHVSMLKRNNVAMALDCAHQPRSARRQRNYDEYPIMRHMCNLESVKTYEGNGPIHALVIGESNGRGSL